MGMSMLELLVNVLMTVSITAVALATVWSFVDYLLRFKDDLKEEKENDNEKVEAEEVSEETTEVVENVENAEENNNVEE
jgi:flagellar basal body-associated protein FliL